MNEDQPYNLLVSSSVIAPGSCVKLGTGLNQLKPNTSGEEDGEGEGGVNPAEYTEEEDEDVHSEYC